MPSTKERLLTKADILDLINIGRFDRKMKHSASMVPAELYSEKRKQHLTRFEYAKEYGRQVFADPGKSALYVPYLKTWKRKCKHIGIYQLAIRDYMHAPSIEEVTFSDGRRGGPEMVLIRAYNEFHASRVAVSIVAPDGEILEEGEADDHLHHIHYSYRFNDRSLLKPGNTLRISVWDLPGNITIKEYDLFQNRPVSSLPDPPEAR